jgi:hypothetical protein
MTNVPNIPSTFSLSRCGAKKEPFFIQKELVKLSLYPHANNAKTITDFLREIRNFLFPTRVGDF